MTTAKNSLSGLIIIMSSMKFNEVLVPWLIKSGRSLPGARLSRSSWWLRKKRWQYKSLKASCQRSSMEKTRRLGDHYMFWRTRKRRISRMIATSWSTWMSSNSSSHTSRLPRESWPWMILAFSSTKLMTAKSNYSVRWRRW